MRIVVLATLISLLPGCAQLGGGLRRDLNDDPYGSSGPTYGGPFAENGFLSQTMGESGYTPERFGPMGLLDRGLASRDPSAGEPGDAWRAAKKGYGPANELSEGTAEEAEKPNSPESEGQVKPSRRPYKNGMRATRADFIDESPNEGSLWASDGQTNYYFTKNKIRGVGDIINIQLDENLVKDMALEVRRRLTPNEADRELALAQLTIKKRALAPEGSEAAGPDKTAATAKTDSTKQKDPTVSSEPEIPNATLSDIDLSKSLEIKTGDSILAEIVERYPNGNYRIRGSRRIPYKNGAPRMMTIMGVVKGSDIGDDDLINAGKLYEYRLEAFR